MDTETVMLKMDRTAYVEKGLGCGPDDAREVLADFGRGDRRYRLVRAVFRPEEPTVVEATFQEIVDPPA